MAHRCDVLDVLYDDAILGVALPTLHERGGGSWLVDPSQMGNLGSKGEYSL